MSARHTQWRIRLLKLTVAGTTTGMASPTARTPHQKDPDPQRWKMEVFTKCGTCLHSKNMDTN